jgi:serine/threonine protein kinase
MAMEIEIHRKLHHKHVVGFHCFFEDDDFIYILLEICRRRVSLEMKLLINIHIFSYFYETNFNFCIAQGTEIRGHL